MNTKMFFFNGSQEQRILFRVPIVEILSEKPKTLADLQAQITPLVDSNHTAEELKTHISSMSPEMLNVFNTNLSQLEIRKVQLGSLFARLDMKALMNTVPQQSSESVEVIPLSAETSPLVSTLEKAGKDFSEGSITTKISYGLGAIAAFTGARWLWRKVFGDPEHEGVLKKTGKWILSILAATAGAVGVSNIRQWWTNNAPTPWSYFTSLFSSALPFLGGGNNKTDGSEPQGSPGDSASLLDLPGKAVNAGKDITQGAGNSFDTLIIQPITGAAEVVKEIVDGNPQKALSLVAEKGWSLFVNEKGEIVVQDTLLKPITAPILATVKLSTSEFRSSDDFWTVWGEAGGAYLIARKTVEAWKTGKQPIPTNLKAVVADAIRIASGPVQAWMDGLRTLVLSTQRDGLKALSLRYGKMSYLGSKFLHSGNIVFLLSIKNEEHAIRLLSKYKRLAEDVRIMRNFTQQGGFVSFSEDEIKAVELVIDNSVDSVKKFLQVSNDLKSPFLRAMKEKVSHLTEADELRKEMAKVFNEFLGNPRSVPAIATAQEATSFVDETIKVADSSSDLARTGDVVADVADAVIPMSRPLTAPTTLPDAPPTPLARAVGDGVVDDIPQAARNAETTAEVAADANGLKVVRKTGEVVDSRTGTIIETIIDTGVATDAVAAATTDIAPAAVRSIDLLEPVLREYAPVKQLLSGARAEEYAKLLAGAQKTNSLSGGKTVARYLLALPSDLDETRRLALMTPEVITLIAEGKSGNPIAIARTLAVIKQTEGVFDAARSLRQLSAWQSSGKLGRSLQGLGIAAEAVMVGVDIYSLVQSYEQREEHRKALTKGLTDAGLTSTDGEKYSGFGIEVSISQLLTADVEKYSVLTATDTVALGAGLAATFLPLGASAGPVGLAVAGVAIAVNYSVNQIFTAFDQREQEQFLAKAPQWLLGMLRTSTLLNKSEHSLIREFNGVMTQDIWPADWKELILGKGIADMTTMRRPENREAIRNKLLQSLCYQALLGKYSDLAAEIPGMASVKDFYGPECQFLKSDGDFERIVKPYITLRLHSMTTGENVSFASTQKIDLSDNRGEGISAWWNDIPTINEHDLTHAVEESMLFYVHHLREVQFREQKKAIDVIVNQEKTRFVSEGITEPELQQKLDLLRSAHEQALCDDIDVSRGRSFVFNQNPFELGISDQGPTLAESILKDKTDLARMGSETHSAELVSRKWALPGKGKDGDISWFASEYITPQFRPATGEHLRARSPERGQPFSFDELEEMGKDRDVFVKAFIARMAPIRSVHQELTNGLKTEASLQKFIDSHESDFTFMESVYRHEQYYRTYLTDWRQVGSGILPENKMSFIRALREWKKSGYPSLVNEENFVRTQEYVRNRPKRNAQIFDLQHSRVPQKPLELRIDTGIAGYSGEKSGLLDLRKYVDQLTQRANSVHNNQQDLGLNLLLGKQERPSLLLQPKITEQSLSQEEAISLQALSGLNNLERLGLQHRYPQDPASLPSSLIGTGDVIALIPEELLMFLQTISQSTSPSLNPVSTSDEGFVEFSSSLQDFSMLQLYLLQSRVFIAVPKP